ncbi:MAG: hypothetical protein Q8862_12055, partial [Bacteroidota bacterium]|nr:hypothetical protein [Bacteroidota bacterium]
MKRFFLLLMLTGLYAGAGASKVKVQGVAPEYAGTKLEFQYIDNPITQHYRTIATCLVSASGNFETEFEADSTLLINISLDANNGFFYAEPGKTYQILLPPLRKKTIREQRSPFFRPSLVHLNILHSDSLELNNLIATLDSTFSSSLQKNLNAIFQNHSRVHAQMIDSLIDHIGRSNTTPFLK